MSTEDEEDEQERKDREDMAVLEALSRKLQELEDANPSQFEYAGPNDEMPTEEEKEQQERYSQERERIEREISQQRQRRLQQSLRPPSPDTLYRNRLPNTYIGEEPAYGFNEPMLDE